MFFSTAKSLQNPYFAFKKIPLKWKIKTGTGRALISGHNDPGKTFSSFLIYYVYQIVANQNRGRLFRRAIERYGMQDEEQYWKNFDEEPENYAGNIRSRYKGVWWVGNTHKQNRVEVVVAQAEPGGGRFGSGTSWKEIGGRGTAANRYLRFEGTHQSVLSHYSTCFRSGTPGHLQYAEQPWLFGAAYFHNPSLLVGSGRLGGASTLLAGIIDFHAAGVLQFQRHNPKEKKAGEYEMRFSTALWEPNAIL